MNENQAAALRAPFPKAQIGKLPRAGIQLDYVGHAAVTSRLLEVDPLYTWEPMAVNADGSPALTNQGLSPQTKMGLWIRLTVAGVTRPGFGDGNSTKECISDAIRNAAMRFGVALDLWAKEDLHASESAAGTAAPKRVQPEEATVAPAAPANGTRVITEAQKDRLYAIAGSLKVPKAESKRIILEVAGVDSSLKIPMDKYEAVVEAIEKWVAVV